MEVNIIGINNNNNSQPHFEDDENENFDETIAIYNDIASANIKLISQLQEQIQKNTKVASVMIICIIAFGLHLLRMLSDTTNSIIEFEPRKERRRQKLKEYLVHTERSRDIIGMGPQAFIQLCQRIRQTELVKDAYRSTMEEQLAKFLHIIGHNVKNQSVSFFFHWSGETVSRHFHNILNAILVLEREFLNQPDDSVVQPQILYNYRFYPYFQVHLYLS